MPKYILTESQLQMIIENKMMNEYIPHPDDPASAHWDNDHGDDVSEPKVVDGSFEMVMFVDHQYLLKNSNTGEYYYTLGDAFNGDIYHAMQDYLPIPQETYNVDGVVQKGSVDGWEDDISDEELANALVSYTNDMASKNMLNVVDNVEEWESGRGEYLLLSQDILKYSDISNVILDQHILDTVMGIFKGGI